MYTIKRLLSSAQCPLTIPQSSTWLALPTHQFSTMFPSMFLPCRHDAVTLTGCLNGVQCACVCVHIKLLLVSMCTCENVQCINNTHTLRVRVFAIAVEKGCVKTRGSEGDAMRMHTCTLCSRNCARMHA